MIFKVGFDALVDLIDLFLMFLFKVPAGTVSYLDIFVLINGWFANNLTIHTILNYLCPSLVCMVLRHTSAS